MDQKMFLQSLISYLAVLALTLELAPILRLANFQGDLFFIFYYYLPPLLDTVPISGANSLLVWKAKTFCENY